MLLYLYLCCVIYLLPLSYCCNAFGDVVVEIKPKHGTTFNKTVHGCISRKSMDIADVATEVKIVSQPVTKLNFGAVENLASVVHIEFTKCPIQTVFARAFRNVPRLETIFLNYGAIGTIKEGIFSNLPSLTKISLAHNQIIKIINGSFDIPSLQILHLSYNKLSSWDKRWFSGSQDVQEVDCRDNLITDLPSNAFDNLRNLTKLTLDSNLISKISRDAFKGLHKLKHLGLTYNFLTSVNLNWFPHRISLSKLTINTNRLNFVSVEVLEQIKPRQIALDGNPWNCECWKETMTWLHNNTGKIITTEQCKEQNVPICVEDSQKCKNRVSSETTRKFFEEVKKSLKNFEGLRKATVHVTATLGSVILEYFFWRAIGNVNDNYCGIAPNVSEIHER
ncbi:hypothetical protein FQA39_LY15430 [Lamprigera yunnana]|nr:hypothetical protein FQA39_LY15430 [Lamprigera yunnana]